MRATRHLVRSAPPRSYRPRRQPPAGHPQSASRHSTARKPRASRKLASPDLASWPNSSTAVDPFDGPQATEQFERPRRRSGDRSSSVAWSTLRTLGTPTRHCRGSHHRPARRPVHQASPGRPGAPRSMNQSWVPPRIISENEDGLTATDAERKARPRPPGRRHYPSCATSPDNDRRRRSESEGVRVGVANSALRVAQPGAGTGPEWRSRPRMTYDAR